jgi:hypothetical protein
MIMTITTKLKVRSREMDLLVRRGRFLLGLSARICFPKKGKWGTTPESRILKRCLYTTPRTVSSQL